MTLIWTSLVGVILTVGAAVVTDVVETATAAAPTKETVAVTPDNPGDATSTLTPTSGPTTGKKVSYFERLRDNTQDQQALSDQYRGRMITTTTAVDAATDRGINLAETDSSGNCTEMG